MSENNAALAGDHDAGLLQTIWTLFRLYPLRSTLVVLLTVLSGMAEAVGVVALLPLIGLAVGNDPETVPFLGDVLSSVLESLGISRSIGMLLGVIVVGIMAKSALKILAMRQAGYAAAAFGRDLRLNLIRAVMRARWGYFTDQPVGSLANAVSGEAQRASQVFTKSTNLFARFIQVVMYIALALVVSWQIALVTLLFGAVMLSALHFLVRITRRAGRRQTEVTKSLISRLSDGLYAIKPLKAMGKEENLQPLLEDETEELNVSQRRQVISKATLESAHEPIITLFVAVIIYVQLSMLAFDFSDVLFIVFLFYRTTMYVGSLQQFVQSFFESESAYWSIQRAIDDAEAHMERPSGGHDVSLMNAIEFRRVFFSYPSRTVLHDASFVIPAYSITALIGPSGSGKTTIVDLITALYLPDSGGILIDGKDLSSADIRSWRHRIGYVPQELILFHDTVLRNIALGDEDVGREEVEQALRAAGAWGFVSALPKGMDSVVGEHGMRLSGGQRQRLAIARALVRNPDLLILDEATTALDPATEQAILATIAELKERVTIIAISHQTGVVEAADRVIRLSPGPNGAIILEGSSHIA